MATAILKKQILKVLSRFTKDVDADQIKFSSLSQAFLSDLVLNEVVLTEVLEFPVWMRISRAVCNRVSIQIPWTNLTSQPIRIGLDEVYVDTETCTEFRHAADAVPTSAGAYGRTEMAVDGMLITVNTLEVHFRAPSFHVSFQVNRVKVFSTTSNYDGTNDLRMTRIKDEARDAILVFKCVAWQTLRVEATSGAKGLNSSSIRFITNAGQARIALKKSLSTSALIASRLHVLMDDLLWVLTPTQLKAALLVMDELKALAAKAETLERTKKAAKKLDANRQTLKKAAVNPNTPAGKMSQYFDKIDITETSYHFHLGKLNLHICDEPRAQDAEIPRKYEDAAILIELAALKVDYYPFHIPSNARRHWLSYQEPETRYLSWQTDFLADYVRKTEKLIPDLPMNPLNMMMTAVWIFRLEDFRVNNMTTFHSSKTKDNDTAALFPLCCSTKKALHLPKHCAALHTEYIVHYFPHMASFPTPPHIMSAFCNPLQVTLDASTVDWLSMICTELLKKDPYHDLASGFTVDMVPDVACRFETILPKIIIPGSSLQGGQPFMKCLQFQSGRVVVTNTQIGRTRTLTESLSTVDRQSDLLKNTAVFPSAVNDPDVTMFMDYGYSLATADSLPLTLWSSSMDPAWIEFVDLRYPNHRPSPFVDSLLVTLWVIPVTFSAGKEIPDMFFAVADVSVPVIKAQSTGEGYNVLMHCNDTVLKVSDSLTKIFHVDPAGSKSTGLVVASVAVLPRVEFTLLLESGEPLSPSSSERHSVVSQLTESGRGKATPLVSVPEAASSSDAFDVGSFGESGKNFLLPDDAALDIDAETRSLNSAMSDASIADMSAFMMENEHAVSSFLNSADHEERVSTTNVERGPDIQRREPSLISPNADLAKTMVRLLSLEVGRIEFAFVMWKEFIVTKLRCNDLAFKEAGDMDLTGAYERYYAQSNTESALTVNGPENPSSVASVRFQMEQLPSGLYDRLSRVFCKDLSLSCSSESISRLGSFFKTDMSGDPVPLELHVRKFMMTLTGGESENQSSPSFRTSVPALVCRRGTDGVLIIEPQTQGSPVGNQHSYDGSATALQQRLDILEKQRVDVDNEIQQIRDALASIPCFF